MSIALAGAQISVAPACDTSATRTAGGVINNVNCKHVSGGLAVSTKTFA